MPNHYVLVMSPSGANQDICVEITDNIAALEDTLPTDLPPLYDVIDPDHLDTILESERVQIELSYYGYQITLTSEGIQLITENRRSN